MKTKTVELRMDAAMRDALNAIAKVAHCEMGTVVNVLLAAAVVAATEKGKKWKMKGPPKKST